MSYSVKSIREQFKANGVFYSDTAIAERLKSYLPEGITEVYDPTCGGGNLLAVFGDDVKKYGQELNPQQAEECRQRLVNCEIAEGDVLTAPAFIDKRFRAISANPPFSCKWDEDGAKDSVIFKDAPCTPPPSKGDFAFILHCLHCLHDDGTAAILQFPGILYRGQREGKIREWLVRMNYIDAVEYIDGVHFEDTKVTPVIIVIKKNRSRTSVTFRDSEHGVEREVSFEEIEANGFNLSVQTYVQPPEPERPPFDPVATEMRARNDVLRRIDAQLAFSTAAIEIHEQMGMPPLPSIDLFIADIIRTAKKYKSLTKEQKKTISSQMAFDF